MGPLIALFTLTMRQLVLSRKIWLTLLLLAAPCVLMLVIRYFQQPEIHARSLWEAYHISSHFFLITTLVPLVCLVHGTGLIGADVESRTITYLTTRRLRRRTVLLVRFAATVLVLAILCDAAVIALHYCTIGGMDIASIVAGTQLQDWNPMTDLGYNLLITPVASACFLAVFSFFGLLFAKPLNVSIIYFILMELTLSNIPIAARVYSISHQLRKTVCGWVPELTALFELPDDLTRELYPLHGSAFLEIGILVLVLLALSAFLMTYRELVPSKLARE